MKMELPNEESNPIHNLLTNCIFQDNLLIKMRVTDTIINSLDSDIKTKTKANIFKKFMQDIFNDIEFMRKFEYNAQLKSNIETSIELLGFDYLSEPEFHFNNDFEKKLSEIHNKLSIFHGALLKELNKGNSIEL